MKLENIIASTFFNYRLTMCQVVGQIKVKLDQLWVKGSFKFTNGAKQREQTHISDIRQK